MTVTAVSLESEILAALDTVADPELDQPITELGFVRSVSIADDGVTVHLRLPTAFCSPNFAYLMASDAYDALRALYGIGEVRVLLDDHHDSDKINEGLAAEAGYVGTFGAEAEESLDELRTTFLRKAHTAAMERCVSCPNSKVVVGDDGRALPAEAVPMRLRFARSVRISMEGNAHFCRGLLATRYDDGGAATPQFTNTRTRSSR